MRGAGPDGAAGRTSGLSARIRVERSRFVLDVGLEVSAGRVLALLGPNGAGKSTVLRVLAGLEPVTAGYVELDGCRLDDPAVGLFVPAEARRVGMVFQDYLLFPHLDLRANVAFGLRARAVPRRAADEAATRWLHRVGLSSLADVRPSKISGGQAQRVALARALAPEPSMLLLDEPLAALDAATRAQVRSDLRRHLASYPGCTVLVTHDALDAMVLADHLVVLEDGHVVQQGAPADVARAPRTQYVARLVGLNLYRGQSTGTAVQVDGGGVLSTSEEETGPVFLAFRPSAVALHPHRPEGSPRNAWQGRVTGMEQHGDTVRVRVEASPPVLADITTAALAELGLEVGDSVWAAVKATEVRSYPA